MYRANYWQPIDTAPTDGTSVLVRFDKTPVSSIPFYCTGWWFASPKEIDDGWETPFGFIGEPTHWMSINEPPIIKEQKDDTTSSS